MEIKPTYVTFEQTKLLKKKGFDKICESHLVVKTNGVNKGKQFIRRGRLDYDDIYLEYIEENIPEQWQVVEWLRVNHGIWVTPIPRLNSWIFSIVEVITSNHDSLIDIDFYGDNDYLTSKGVPTIIMSPQEAYSAAFDYVLNNLL